MEYDARCLTFICLRTGLIPRGYSTVQASAISARPSLVDGEVIGRGGAIVGGQGVSSRGEMCSVELWGACNHKTFVILLVRVIHANRMPTSADCMWPTWKYL